MLYSLVNFVPVTKPLLDSLDLHHVVEIGCELGGHTGWLAAYAAVRGARLTIVDVAPRLDPETRAMAHVNVIQAKSVDYLADTDEGADVYFVDGEHAYATVAEELERIAARIGPDQPGIVFLHDTSWPWGNRDSAGVPEENGVHAPATGGPRIDLYDDDLTIEGLPVTGCETVAPHAGGPRNGVRPAVDEFLEAHPAWTGTHVQGCFGLSVLWRPERLTAAQRETFGALRAASERLGAFLATVELGRLHALCELHRARSEAAHLRERRARRRKRPLSRLRRWICGGRH